MGKPIYMVWRNRAMGAWWRLSKEEREAFVARIMEAHEQAGAKVLIGVDVNWSTEQWQNSGVTEFRDVDALQKFSRLLREMNHDRYFLAESMLGTKWEAPA